MRSQRCVGPKCDRPRPRFPETWAAHTDSTLRTRRYERSATWRARSRGAGAGREPARRPCPWSRSEPCTARSSPPASADPWSWTASACRTRSSTCRPATTWNAARSQRHVLGAHAEEAADADDVGFDLAVLVEQDVAHVADLLVVGADHVGALELRRQPLILPLRVDELRRAGRRSARLADVGAGLQQTWSIVAGRRRAGRSRRRSGRRSLRRALGSALNRSSGRVSGGRDHEFLQHVDPPWTCSGKAEIPSPRQRPRTAKVPRNWARLRANSAADDGGRP